MIIGGLQKNSFIDYPGKICCVLFLSGCNFHCPYCQNPELVKGRPSEHIIPKDIYAFLESHKPFLDGVVISGGEPTLQDDLDSLCRQVRSIGFPVKLDTNGSRPEILRELIEKDLIDYIAMDIKTEPSQYAPLIQKDCNHEDIITSIRVIRESSIPHEFRTTCVKPFVNQQTIQRICEHIEGTRLYILQRFNHTEVLKPEFFLEEDRNVDDDELMLLKSTAASHVQRCIIR